MNLAFYTYFYGTDKNTSFTIPSVPSLKYNCYYFTNNLSMINLLKDTNWICIFDDVETKDDNFETMIISKRVKAKPHEYPELTKYDYLCMLDNKYNNINEPLVEAFIKEHMIKHNNAIIIRRHWFVPPNIWNEYNESMLQGRYNVHSEHYKNYIEDQIKNGFNEITPLHGCSGFMIRNMKHKKIIDFNNNWYRHILECGIQCQISLFFVKQLFPDDILILDFNPSIC